LLQRACTRRRTLLAMASAQQNMAPQAVAATYERGMFGLFAGAYTHVALSHCTFFGGHLPLLRACKHTYLHISDCCFLGSKGNTAAVMLRDSSLAMQRSMVAHGATEGISTYGSLVQVAMQDCCIVHNAGYGVAAHLPNAPVATLFRNNKVVSNGLGSLFGHVVA